MIFNETELKGAFIIDLERHQDDRGFFARTFCQKELEAHGLISDVAQANMSLSKTRGTLRGMHYQKSPFEETKLVRCTQRRALRCDYRSETGFAHFQKVDRRGAHRRQLPNAVCPQEFCPRVCHPDGRYRGHLHGFTVLRTGLRTGHSLE